jgi:adenine-specific DNA-methyltransferase
MSDEIRKMDLRSMDVTVDRIEQLKAIFPEAVTEGKVDFEKLKRSLGESVEAGIERYGMNWAGKSDCFRIIQQPSVGSLKPVRGESVNFDESENLFIEGDNLEVLKLLQKSYYGKIKMIYIDPPYNTGGDFIYPDDYTENLDTYLKYTGQVDDEGRKYSTNTEAEGRFHTKWINMMYSRLYLSRNLLRDDGVAFINIDDIELSNLRKVCDEIFGEDNFRGMISRATGTRMGSGNKKISSELDYILIYSRSDKFDFYALPMTDSDLSIYDQEDENGKYLIRSLRRTGGENRREDRPTMYYPISAPDGTEIFPLAPEGWESRWICSKEKYEELKEEGLIEWKKVRRGDEEKWQVYQRHYLGEATKQASNNWIDIEGNKKATRDLNSLFDGRKLFDHPKPIELLTKSIEIGTSESDIVLDFFAGSSTTAHAVLELNKRGISKRRFIMIQLPELCDENSVAFREGYKTIADIGKDRVRRVIRRIQDENQGQLDYKDEMDLGFRVYRLDRSNFKIWDAADLTDAEAIQEQLELHVDHVDPDSKPEDILYELLLKSGFELTTKVEKIQLEGKDVFSIADGMLLICLEHELTKEAIRAMAEREPARVICLDTGFKNNDQLKTNAVQIMKSKGIEDFLTV